MIFDRVGGNFYPKHRFILSLNVSLKPSQASPKIRVTTLYLSEVQNSLNRNEMLMSEMLPGAKWVNCKEQILHKNNIGLFSNMMPN